LFDKTEFCFDKNDFYPTKLIFVKFIGTTIDFVDKIEPYPAWRPVPIADVRLFAVLSEMRTSGKKVT
jgi:hypothetical protein